MNIAHLLDSTVTVQSQTGSSGYGDPVWASPRTIACRVNTVNRRVPSAQGIAIVAASVLLTDQPIKEGDRFWLPGTDTSDAKQARHLSDVKSSKALSGSPTLYQGDF